KMARGSDVVAGSLVGEAESLSAQAATAAPVQAPSANAFALDGALAKDKRRESSAEGRAADGAKAPDLGQVSARRNLNETAFFFPQLLSDGSGEVKLQFTMPEALTQWRFLAFAHHKQMRSGMLEGHAVTAKDLMVQPNPPRFLREEDLLEFTVKVSNQTTNRLQGKVRLTFNDARTMESADKLLGNASPELSFELPAKESRSYAWRIHVPDGAPPLSYKAVGATDRVSDGEEGFLPVLSHRIFITESLPLPIRGRADGPVTKRFEFTKLLNSGKSRSLVNQN